MDFFPSHFSTVHHSLQHFSIWRESRDVIDPTHHISTDKPNHPIKPARSDCICLGCVDMPGRREATASPCRHFVISSFVFRRSIES
ncbi:hypothetical protein BU26DRAFT_184664 [Trematosphaeria pertusa]|uniref:Uncharacterized protein n=1 Tax=Trematosphaeria pertusa TaxID=390896 RepID=A0A6A6HSE8_9PLEO|nr:uncharacterized protein BU26DRAFT_184664 [Trematosphaeria pertusa]KAF2240941.1 hypothetical protein BU26DRAFT_184664 [Trematosphaeria pertusa]